MNIKVNLKSIYYFTLVNKFHKADRFFDVIDHGYNTKCRAQERYKVKQFFNKYDRNELSLMLLTICNMISKDAYN